MQDQPAQPVLPTTSTRLDPNPIPHLTEGVKNMVRTNLKPLIGAIAANAAIPAAFVIAAFIAMTKFQNAQLLWDAVQRNIALVAVFAGVALLASICLGLVLNRVILLGAQAKSTTFNETLHFSTSRLLPTIGIYILLGLLLIAPAALIGVLMWQVSPFFGLFLLPLVIVYVAVSFFLAPLSFVVVDTPPLRSFMTVLQRLKGLWKHGFLVLILYILCMNFVGGGMSSVGNGFWSLPSGSSSSSSSTQNATEESGFVQSDSEAITEDFELKSITFDVARWVVGIGGIAVIFFTIIATTMQTFLMAGFAHVYSTVMSRAYPEAAGTL